MKYIFLSEIISFATEHPTQGGPYGAVGVGEIARIPTATVIVNAIHDAVGVRVDHLPADHEFIWRACYKAKNCNGNS